MTTIRRVRITAVDTVDVTTDRPADLGAGEVRIRPVHVGLCGSDTHALHGRHPHITLPYAPGHEVVGAVTELGAAVDTVAIGDRVVVEPTLPDWTCKQCLLGRPNLCEQLEFFGCGHEQGALADEFVVRADRLHLVPDDMDDLTAALIEPLSTPVHAARICGPLQDQAVVILGSGTIGLLMLAAARHDGARRIVMTDPLAAKRETALRLGADAVVDASAPDMVEQVRRELGESADVVFDCVAVESTIQAGVTLATKGGTVAIVGVPSRDVVTPVVAAQDNQVRIQGCATYVADDFRTAIGMLRAGEVRAADFITARFSLDEAEQAFAAASSGDQIKVVVSP